MIVKTQILYRQTLFIATEKKLVLIANHESQLLPRHNKAV